MMKTSKHMLIQGFLFATFIMLSPAFASEDGGQLDRIESKVGTVISTQEKILEVIDEDPLQGKKFGIEINPFRLLFIDKDNKTFSGSLSFFNVKPNVEISFPFYTSVSRRNNLGDFRVFTLDGHYRYFLGKRTNGFYISGFSRFAALQGTFGSDYQPNNSSAINERGATYKLGAGFGIGYRIFSKRGFYWGASLNLGRYFIGDSNQYRSSSGGLAVDIDDLEYIIDVEFFKIGYAF